MKLRRKRARGPQRPHLQTQLRALVDARNSDDAWNLKCLIRERLIQFLQEKYLGSLPRIRGEINAGPNNSPLEHVPYPERVQNSDRTLQTPHGSAPTPGAR